MRDHLKIDNLMALYNAKVLPKDAKSTAYKMLIDAQFSEIEANEIVANMMRELKYDLTSAPAKAPVLVSFRDESKRKKMIKEANSGNNDKPHTITRKCNGWEKKT